jgi:LacI family transcriptional regulator, galactose operon repressor
LYTGRHGERLRDHRQYYVTASSDERGRRRRAAGRGTPRNGDSRRVTIDDVAKEAGVSVSAVSKVVRDAYGVSPQMRAKVTAAIDKLGYRPNAGARAMRGRSFTIGVMVIDIGSTFQTEVVAGASAELDPTPFQEIVIVGGGDPPRQQRCIESLVDRQVDGLILVAPMMSQSWLEALGASLPTVVIARHGGGTTYDTVVDDEQEGARLLVDHLVGLGHQRILHTSHPAGELTRPFVLSHTARHDGYVEAMRRRGLEPDVIETSYSEPGGYQAAIEALARPTPPTAIFAGADVAAFGVLRATEELGLRVPEDVTVVGYDNIFTSSIGRISLTTVDQSGHQTGAKAARLLLERIEGRTQPVHYILAPRLVPRSTSAASPRDAASRSSRRSVAARG